MPYYPIFLDISGLPCLVVGGGETARQKTDPLLECGGQVTLVSPTLIPPLRRYADDGRIGWQERGYRSGDTDGFRLVICATDDTAVNRQVFEEAEGHGIPVNVVDVPSQCRFITPSVLRRGALCIAVSTGGKSPAMAKKIRRQLETQFGPEYAALLELLGDARARMKERFADDAQERLKRYEKLTDSDLLDLIRANKMDEARNRVEACLSR
ncbi:MAG: bifunctional precorrin-2 dehydrogenase/sirohydrochlorin ferrochelatase [candidate division Zixibacteria bacterium]|nr:bifunctional precorrin-2 dehydrogenase/sirohydrochlorin ferrochelatase [candidate division Zixibacteria bacterium]